MLESGHFVLLSGDACLVTAGRVKLYGMVISSEPKGKQMMSIQRLISISCAGILIVLTVIGWSVAGNSPAINNNHPLPVRAPAPIQAAAQTTPAASHGMAPTAVQPLPQPQPVPVPPAAMATTPAPIQSGSASVGLLLPLLVVAMAGLLMVLAAALVTGRRRENGRFAPTIMLTHGAQS